MKYKEFLERTIATSNDHLLQQEAVLLYSTELGKSVAPVLIDSLFYYISEDDYREIAIARHGIQRPVPQELRQQLLDALGYVVAPFASLDAALLFDSNWDSSLFPILYSCDMRPLPCVVDKTTVWLPRYLYSFIAHMRLADVEYAGYVMAMALGSFVAHGFTSETAGGWWQDWQCPEPIIAAIRDDKNWIAPEDDFVSFYHLSGNGFDAYITEGQYTSLASLFAARRYSEMASLLRQFFVALPPISYDPDLDSIYDVCKMKDNWVAIDGEPRRPDIPGKRMPHFLSVRYRLYLDGMNTPIAAELPISMYLRVRALLPRVGGSLVATWLLEQELGVTPKVARLLIKNESNWNGNPPRIEREFHPPLVPDAADL